MHRSHLCHRSCSPLRRSHKVRSCFVHAASVTDRDCVYLHHIIGSTHKYALPSDTYACTCTHHDEFLMNLCHWIR